MRLGQVLKASGGQACVPEYDMSYAPAHAGRLHPEEQLAFATVFALMAGFVVIITMFAVRSPGSLLVGPSAIAGTQTVSVGTGGVTRQPSPPAADSVAIGPASARLNASLAVAMGTVLRAHPGQLAVGVIDVTTGQQALYGATRHFTSGSVVTADILATLLIRQQHTSAPVTSEQAALATAMMHNGSNMAATSLWRAVGGANGLAAANRLLELKQTVPGAGDRWDQTTTTVRDQLQLLIDLTSARSPLTAAGRDLVLRLMSSGGTQPGWGVSAAGIGKGVQNGWLPVGKLWVANSIGVVAHGGHVLLVAVLSGGSASRLAGISLASAAAVAAVEAISP